ncbi:hypothetical protein [Candidatus Berkiella aquae]|uniref:Uncharacterized protein n=1 Tax=Candidatus Berkiella aquae TaxID=295108 RepID=A0A0Q9YZN9_9GAMM|nr:hypothetical protein [Candidatus Berkiella aquae]MCS5712589.1 hypothetical protein [Candidatus Berkiella aquae]
MPKRQLESTSSAEPELKRRLIESQQTRYQTIKDNCVKPVVRIGAWLLNKIAQPFVGQAIYWGMDLHSLPVMLDKKAIINDLFKDSVEHLIFKTTPEKIEYLRKLLALGADANLKMVIKTLPDGTQPYITPLSQAILNKDEKFLKLLDEFHVDLFSPIMGNLNYSEQHFDLSTSLALLAEEKILPLQHMTGKKNLDIRKRISRETKLKFPWIYQKGTDALKAYYKTLLQKILEQVKISKDHNKKLLILIGEYHNNAHGFLMELLVILIVNRHCNVKNVHFELDETRLNLLNKADAKATYFLIPQVTFGTWKYLIKLTREQLKGEAIPIDTLVSCLITEDELNEERMKNRNQNMMSHLNKSDDPVTVGIVGAAHLFGLQTECDLSQFHVFSISTVPDSFFKHELPPYIEKCRDFLTTKEVFSAANYPDNNVEAKVFESFLTYSKLVKVANKIHDNEDYGAPSADEQLKCDSDLADVRSFKKAI